MATVRTVTVKPDGTGDYTSLANAIAGESKDLVSLDRQLNILCSAMDNDVGASPVSVSGFVTDATRFVSISAAPGSEHGGDYTRGFRITASGATTNALLIGANYTLLDGIVVNNTGFSPGPAIKCTATNLVLNRLIVSARASNAATVAAVAIQQYGVASGGALLKNCLLLGISANGYTPATGVSVAQNPSAAGLTLYNVTSTGWTTGLSIDRSGAVAKNCLCFGNTSSDFNTGQFAAASCSNNASGDSSAPGASSKTLIASPFTNAVAYDFSLKSDSVLIDAGANLSGVGVVVDIAGTARPQGAGYDIGAFEFVSGGSGTPLALSGLSEGSGVTSASPTLSAILSGTSPGVSTSLATALSALLSITGTSPGMGDDTILSGAIPHALSGTSAGSGDTALASLLLTLRMHGASTGVGADSVASVLQPLALSAVSTGRSGDLVRLISGLPAGADAEFLGLLLWSLWLKYLEEWYRTT